MRNLAKVLILSVISFFFGCASDKYEVAMPEKHSITIINFGGADSAYNKVNTKGFGINYYAFIDLNTDSVFTRQKYELEERIRVTVKTGSLKNLGKNDTILEGLAALIKLPNSFIKGTETKGNEGLIYCGPHAYLEYQFDNEKKYYFYTHHELDSTIENMSRLLLSLDHKMALNELNSKIKFDEDKILLPIIKLDGMKNFNTPPIKSAIKFTPPVIRSEEDSTQKP